jgi:acyl-CoA hydrolase
MIEARPSYRVTIPEYPNIRDTGIGVFAGALVAELAVEGVNLIVQPNSDVPRLASPNELSAGTQEAKDLKTSIAQAKDSGHTITGLTPLAEGGAGVALAAGIAIAVTAYRRFRS